MLELNYYLQHLDVQWRKLKVYDDVQVAVAAYRPVKNRKMRVKGRKITVTVFSADIGFMGEETITALNAVTRTFRKDEKKIADWYFRELCKTFRHGILEPDAGENRRPAGRWD